MVLYDCLNLKYGDNNPAVLRHLDGSGFAYYVSGRKAICINAFGNNGKGQCRRFSAVIHDDTSKGNVIGLFDEWGRGYAEGQANPGSDIAPKMQILEDALAVTDSNGQMNVTPIKSSGTGGGAAPEFALRLNQHIVVKTKAGRTSIDFVSEHVQHEFQIGELQGDAIRGMPKATDVQMQEQTQKDLKHAHGIMKTSSALSRDKTTTFRIDPAVGGKAKSNIDTTNISDILKNLNDLTATLHEGWTTENGLKKSLANHHKAYHRRTISKWSGKCTDEQLASVKHAGNTPKTVTEISHLKLAEIVETCSTKNTLLVVICLASYSSQSNHAKKLVESAHAELVQRYGDKDRYPYLPFRFVIVELAEDRSFGQKYGIKEVPFCLMFSGGQIVYQEKLGGMKMVQRDTYTARPRVLLVEPNPNNQLKIERALKRAGFSSDLAVDASVAAQFATREQYGVLLLPLTGCSRDAQRGGNDDTQVVTRGHGTFNPPSYPNIDQLKVVIGTVRQKSPGVLIFAYAPAAVDEDERDAMRLINDECAYIFQHLPGQQSLAAVLSRHKEILPSFKHTGTSSGDFVNEVEKMMDASRGTAPRVGAAK